MLRWTIQFLKIALVTNIPTLIAISGPKPGMFEIAFIIFILSFTTSLLTSLIEKIKLNP